jgi:hypothetical protein
MPELSRRSVILKGAGLAAAGVVVGAAVPLAAEALSAEPGTAPATTLGSAANPELPVMVHLRDASAGNFDVFVGTRRVEVTDRAFAARLSHIASS